MRYLWYVIVSIVTALSLGLGEVWNEEAMFIYGRSKVGKIEFLGNIRTTSYVFIY